MTDVYAWRLDQEIALRSLKGSGMTDEQVKAFVDDCKFGLLSSISYIRALLSSTGHGLTAVQRLSQLRAVYRDAQKGYFRWTWTRGGRQGKTVTLGCRDGPKGQGGP